MVFDCCVHNVVTIILQCRYCYKVPSTFLIANFNLKLNNFPKVDFGGFWICSSTKNSASFDTKISSIPIFSGSNPSTARLCKSHINSCTLVTRWSASVIKVGVVYSYQGV